MLDNGLEQKDMGCLKLFQMTNNYYKFHALIESINIY